jgi:hypothetical protein
VIDYRRQAPLSGARVSFTSGNTTIHTYTDIEGIYRLIINTTDRLRGELNIEADGYRNYKSTTQLSPQQTELLDIRLLELNSDINDRDNSYLLPIVIGAAIALFIIAILILNSAPRRHPEYRRNNPSRNFQNDELFLK